MEVLSFLLFQFLVWSENQTPDVFKSKEPKNLNISVETCDVYYR